MNEVWQMEGEQQSMAITIHLTTPVPIYWYIIEASPHFYSVTRREAKRQ